MVTNFVPSPHACLYMVLLYLTILQHLVDADMRQCWYHVWFVHSVSVNKVISRVLSLTTGRMLTKKMFRSREYKLIHKCCENFKMEVNHLRQSPPIIVKSMFINTLSVV